jgi:hypothetical protein
VRSHFTSNKTTILLTDTTPGITVSKTGRKFSNYPSGLDPNNTNTGSNNKYAVAELIGNATETPYPSAEIKNPPGGAINFTTVPPTGANYQNYLIGVQSVVLDAKDRLWILDTGRALLPDGTLVLASYGGPKLIGVDISTNTIIKTIVFPATVAYGDSYLNDVRFDLRPSVSACGEGVAYLTDSSSEGRNGIIIVDLGTGESWRHLDGIAEVRADRGFVPYVWGKSHVLHCTHWKHTNKYGQDNHSTTSPAPTSLSPPCPSAVTVSHFPPMARTCTSALSAAAVSSA